MATKKERRVMVDEEDVAPEADQGTWVRGPIDWPDVTAVKRALQAWSKGAKLDFEISEDVFYKLLSCKGASDDEYFDFSSGRIRWRDQSASNHDRRRSLEAANAAASIDFPTTLSRVAGWYCFAQTLTACSLPSYVIQILEAKDYGEAEMILQAAERESKIVVDKMVKKLLNTPQKPANAYVIAQHDRDEARVSQRVVKACLDALRRAERNKIKFAYLTELSSAGMAAARIDYPALLQLTTLRARTLGEGGDYALRMDGSRVVGIGPGSGSPAFDPVYEDGEMLAMAHHQSDAVLDLPTVANRLVIWVFDQGGGVELAIPELGRPETPEEWIVALAKLTSPSSSLEIEPDARSSTNVGLVPEKEWEPIEPSAKGHWIGLLVVKALNELKMAPDHPAAIGQIFIWAHAACQSKQHGLALVNGKVMQGKNEVTRAKVGNALRNLRKPSKKPKAS